MTRHSIRLASALVIAGATTLSAQLPKTSPPPLPLKPAALPAFQEATLANGLRILLVESRRQPVVSLALMLPAGDAYDPKGREGLSTIAAGVITKGAGNRTADDVSSAIEGVGGSIGAISEMDFLTVRASVLAENAPLAFELVGDAVTRPTFDAREVEIQRTQLLSSLQLNQSSPAALASRYFAKQLFGGHPYSTYPTPVSVSAVTMADLKAYQKSRLVPGGALLVVAGDISLARARELAQKGFGAWSGRAPAAAKRPAPPARGRTEILLVHRPGSVQSNIIVGNLTYAPNDPDYYGLTVANRILGGGSDSRLFKILREQKSWTYGAYSSTGRRRDIGTFEATAEVRNVVTDSALAEMLSLTRSMGSTPVGAAELDAARNGLTGSMPLQLETAQGIAEQVGLYTMLGLPKDFIRTRRVRLGAVSAAHVQRAAKRLMRPDQALIVVVGDGAQVYDKLAKFGPVKIVNAQGDAMTAGDLVAKATTLPVDITKIVAVHDSFTVMVQGNPFGFQTSTLTKTTGGFEYTDNSVLGPILQQRVTVAFGADLAPTSTKGGGKVQGQEMKVDVSYAGGRVKGSSTSPGPTGMKTVNFDTTVTAGVLDDNMIVPLIPGLRWVPNAKYTMNAFDAAAGTTKELTLAVVATESVTVPAGTFQAYKLELTGGEQVRGYYITTAAPHRILKMTLAGTPIEIVLVK